MQGQDAAQMQQQQEAINRFVDRVEIKKFKILLIPSDIFCRSDFILASI